MQLSDFLFELGKHISGELRTDEYSRVLYSTDASIYQVKPYGVLIPRTLEDVQAAVTLAAQYQVPLLPRAGGSSLAGQAVNEALVIDMSRHLDQLIEVNVEERWARVQAGLVFDELNLRLKSTGLQFGPDPASGNRAGMGGIVGNNSTGSHSILYGMTADHVREMNVILNNGSTARFGAETAESLRQKLAQNGRAPDITRQLHQLVHSPENQAILRRQTPRHWRRCGGYNLDRLLPPDGSISYRLPPDPHFNIARLLCGAEGTLGVMTDVTLNLVPRPQMTGIAVVQFDAGVAALQAVPAVLEMEPSAVELLDHLQIQLCRNTAEYTRLLRLFVEGDPYCLLIVEFYGGSEAELAAKIERLQRHLAAQKVGGAVVPVLEAARQQAVWQVRKGVLGLLMSMRGDYKPLPFIEDSAVPVEHLPEYVTKLEQFCADLGTKMAYYAHASAGCLHIRPIINAKKASEIAKLPQIAQFAMELLRGYGGAWSSEHGDGRSRSWLNEAFFGPELYGLYRQVKQIFDPDNLFNPGNIVNAGPMSENLRYGETYEVIPITPHLDFSQDHGLHRAVEMCNGAGICRKVTTGAMCPSFMATREEEHSTRGRANALRAALSGRLPPTEFTSPRMYQVLALCVSCKACKSECPSSVDMAKIKSEFLAQYHDVHGIPLRDRLFAAITPLSRLGSGALAPLANWGLRNPLLRQGMARLLGIAPQRTLPPFTRTPFHTWFRQRPQPTPGSHAVVLVADTYVTYNYPEVGQAATAVLEAAGCHVTLADVTDCGRPALSKGLIEKARKTAQQVIVTLAPLAEQGLPIVFLEPSDLSAVVDDYEALLPNNARARLVAQQALSFETYLAQRAAANDLNLPFTTEARRVILHGHCHQKALEGTAAARAVLSLPPNYIVTELDTSCCGMAGSFGYEAEHYDISLKMGERRLLPGVRAASPETIIAAAGVSCRQQIKHGAARQALHPAQVLQAALRPTA